VFATVNVLDTFDDGNSLKGSRGDLPGREFDHLFPRQYVGAKQFPYGSHAYAELLSGLFSGERALRLLVVRVVGRQAGRGGHGLLTGLLRCRRCGRMLYTYYSGRGDLVRYMCRGLRIVHGGQSCISFAGTKPEQRVVAEILRAVGASAVEAALQAAKRAVNQEQARLQALSLQLEQARYQARLAERRYESADPENRLVTGELETRWNAALRDVADLEEGLRTVERTVNAAPIPDQSSLMRLAEDLESAWSAPGTDLRLKQRIVRTLIEEIVVDVDQPANQVVMLIHWSGGRHTELHITKPKTGEHGHKTATEAVEVVKQMAGQYPDDVIAGTLNRLGFSTGYGNTWKKHLVCSLRSKLDFPITPRTHEVVLTKPLIVEADSQLSLF